MSVLDGTEGQTSELHVLTEVAKTLTAHRPLPELLEAVMERIAEVLEPAEFGVVLLWNPSEGVLHPQAACGLQLANLAALQEIGLQEGESVTGKVFAQGEAVVLSDTVAVAEAMANIRPVNRDAWLKALGSERLPSSLVVAPLWAGDQKFGVLILGTLSSYKAFSTGDVPFVQILTDLIAMAIDRARLEAQTQASQEATQADRLRAEALATLSHELRTPLGIIKGYCTALLLNEVAWPEEKWREFLHLIDEECQSLELMVANVLDSSLINVGQLTLEYQPVRLERLVREVADEMQVLTDHHQIVLDFPADLPIMDADLARLKQVFRNLINNAIKYSPEGGLVVIRGQARSDDMVISIADQGVGISPEDLLPLFEKYIRAKSLTGRHIPGTGLGLPVARAIVEAHSGRIWAESQPGAGTTFYVSIPRQGLSVAVEAGRD